MVDFQKSPSSDIIWHGTKTSRDFVVRLAASRPKKLAPLAKKLMRLTCRKSIRLRARALSENHSKESSKGSLKHSFSV